MMTFRNTLADKHLSPLWDVFHDLITPSPASRALPQKWAYQDTRPLLIEAGRKITAAEAERRVLILENAGLPNQHTITDSLYAGLQLVLPGEKAPVHRHSQSAIRFVLEGDGGFTIVDQAAFPMRPFDLILTPNWSWHEHIGGGSPTIWLDGLDIPIVANYSANFAEVGASVVETPAQSVDPAPFTATPSAFYAPVEQKERSSADGPLLYFPYSAWREALEVVSRQTDPCPFTGWSIEFINPACGNSVMNTISAEAYKFGARTSTLARRGTENSVITVTQGNGAITIGDHRFAVSVCDVIAVPCWSEVTIEAGDQDLVLFKYSDKISQQKLGVWRESQEQ